MDESTEYPSEKKHFQESNWEHEGKPPFAPTAKYDVWKTNGDVRLISFTEHGTAVYKDCIHSAQNAHCDMSDVLAWRISTNEAGAENERGN